ncbi:MAG: hypothetical protein ACJAWV_003981, partial [Flammeovirgaceae bacterium]
NPVKASLCENTTDWKWTWVNELYNDVIPTT